MEENRRQKETADAALREKEQALADRERQLKEQSDLSAQELEAAKRKIAEERQQALEEAKKQGSTTAAARIQVSESKAASEVTAAAASSSGGAVDWATAPKSTTGTAAVSSKAVVKEMT